MTVEPLPLDRAGLPNSEPPLKRVLGTVDLLIYGMIFMVPIPARHILVPAVLYIVSAAALLPTLLRGAEARAEAVDRAGGLNASPRITNVSPAMRSMSARRRMHRAGDPRLFCEAPP